MVVSYDLDGEHPTPARHSHLKTLVHRCVQYRCFSKVGTI
jgi:hypothetical protein